MRKTRADSRAGCWGCRVSGMALSKGDFAYVTPIVYFVFGHFVHPVGSKNQLCPSSSDVEPPNSMLHD